MRELTKPLPGKRSRTSTQAIRVPMTALMTVTIAETIRVSLTAYQAASFVIASQNPLQPSSKAPAVRAASGMSTMMLM